MYKDDGYLLYHNNITLDNVSVVGQDKYVGYPVDCEYILSAQLDLVNDNIRLLKTRNQEEKYKECHELTGVEEL